MELAVIPNGPIVPAECFDISFGGIGITAGVTLQRGQLVQVRFNLPGGSDGAVEVLGRTAYSLAEDGENRIGIQFLEQVRTSRPAAIAQRDDQRPTDENDG
jgi:hypothetical protein